MAAHQGYLEVVGLNFMTRTLNVMEDTDILLIYALLPSLALTVSAALHRAKSPATNLGFSVVSRKGQTRTRKRT